MYSLGANNFWLDFIRLEEIADYLRKKLVKNPPSSSSDFADIVQKTADHYSEKWDVTVVFTANVAADDSKKGATEMYLVLQAYCDSIQQTVYRQL
jgi:hypothetical protein